MNVMANNNDNNDNEVVHEELQDNFKQEPLTEDEVASNIKSEDATNDLHADKTGYNKSLDGIQTIEENGLIHYKGSLGDFTYHLKEYQIVQVVVEPDEYGNAGGSMPVLKYIGSETDGKKIKIPEGATNLTLTFADTNITSVPKIPSSVESTSYMFSNCARLTNADISIPPKVRSTAAMFAGCDLLTRGPREIPGTVEDMSAMYAGCENLQNMPKLNFGIQCMDSSFANCISLTQKPKIPRSVVVSDYVTTGCIGIDGAESNRLFHKQTKEMDRLNKKLESNHSFVGHIGNTLGTILQVGVLTYAGHDVIEAALVVHTLHKLGQLEKGLTGVWGAIAQTTDHAHPFIQSLYQASVTEHRKANERATFDIKAMKESYRANLTASGNELNARMFKAGREAAKNDRFVAVAKSENRYASTEVFRSSFSNGFDQLEQNILKMQKMGCFDHEHKSDITNAILEMVSAGASYYQGGKSVSLENRERQSQNEMGVGVVNNTMMNLAVNKMIDLQTKYNILSEHHIKEIQDVMASTSYGQDIAFQTNFEQLHQLVNTRSQSHIERFMHYGHIDSNPQTEVHQNPNAETLKKEHRNIENSNQDTAMPVAVTDIASPFILHHHTLHQSYQAGAMFSFSPECLERTDKNTIDNLRYHRVGVNVNMIQDTCEALCHGANKGKMANEMMAKLDHHLAFTMGANAVHCTDAKVEAIHKQNLMVIENASTQSLSQGFVRLQKEHQLFTKDQLEMIIEKLKMTSYGNSLRFQQDANGLMKFASILDKQNQPTDDFLSRPNHDARLSSEYLHQPSLFDQDKGKQSLSPDEVNDYQANRE